MSKNATLAIKITTFYLIANIFEKAIDFFLLPVFTSVLSPADYGIVSTYLSYVSIFSVFISLSLGSSVRFAVIDYKDKLDSYVSSLVTLQIIIALLVSVVVGIISKFFLPDEYHILTIFCLLHAFFGCIISMVSLRYMVEMKYVKRSMLLIMPNLLAIPLSIMLIRIYPTIPYMGRIVGILSTIGFVGFIYTIILLLRGKQLVSLANWKYAIKYSLPLVFHGLTLVLLNQIDRTMLTSIRGVSDTGIYSVACSFGSIAFAFTTAMENTWIPWFYRMAQKGDYIQINKYSKIYTWTCVLLSCGIIFLSPEVVKVFINDAYWPAIGVIPFLVGGTFFKAVSGLPINAMYYTKKTRMIAASSLLALVVTLLLNYMLIPKFGAIGAAISSAIAYMVLFIMQSVSTKIQYTHMFPNIVFILQGLIIMAVVTVGYITQENFKTRWLLTAIIVLIYGLILHKSRLLNNVLVKKKNDE
ncbi:MAG: oligosaccharide flippase family protein [Candidatus Izemoplasmatales bacterium]